MIKFLNNNKSKPYTLLRKKYKEALLNNQKAIEAICISSFDTKKKLVDSRFVNLKIIDNDKFIFFTNYDSPKSKQFEQHNQISATIYWQSINLQIRLKAVINKTTVDFNKKYFETRSSDKNALAISSNQSQSIESFEKVKEKFIKIREAKDLQDCPDYWGGFEFKPFSIEFWEGNDFRLNKRNLYVLENGEWKHYFLEP